MRSPNFDLLANSAESFPGDVFYLDQKLRESLDTVEFELAVASDVEGLQLPRRQVITNAFAWRYRGDGCGHAGPYVVDANDNPTSDASADQCGKRLKG